MISLKQYQKRLDKLKKKLLPASSVLIVTHDYPDPDCLGAAFGVQKLLSHWEVSSTQITFGGFVGRAENRAMIHHLSIETIPIVLLDFSDFEKIIIVDSFPGNGHISLPKNSTIDVVFDHHPRKLDYDPPFLFDLRPELGSTSTLITQYLRAAECTIDSSTATALFYGIKTDTQDMARHTGEEDIDCYKLLFDLLDHSVLSKIERPDREPEYFIILQRAVEAMELYKDVGYTHLGTVSSPDSIAEIADLFHSLEGLEWMISSAIFNKQLFFSLRSKHVEKAGIIAETLASTLGGSGGGHVNMAAGKIPLKKGDNQEIAVKMFKKNLFELMSISLSDAKKIK